MFPPLDTAGILTAILSAAIFTVAIVYAVRSRAVDIATPLGEALAGEKAQAARELFATVLLEERPGARGLLLSIALHLFVLLGTPLLPYLFPDKIQFDFRRYNVKIMEFRLPRPALSAPDPQTARLEPRRPQPAALQKPGGAKGRRGPKRAPFDPSAVAANKPKLQLPESRKAPSKDVIVQPDQPPEITADTPTPLPTAFLWAQGPAPLDVSRTVGAPQRPDLPAFSLPRAVAMVQKPNRVRAVSDLQIGAAPVLTFRLPQLPVPAANISPAQMPGPDAERGELPASALPGGDPMNLIALMRTPAPPTPGYLLAAGNRLAEPQPGTGAGPGGENGESGLGDENLPLLRGSHVDMLKAIGTNFDPGSAFGGGGSIKDVSPRAPAPPVTQPAPGGSLGVIIVQQSSQETVLEGGDVLSGQPVYTVYFDVPGGVRRWILQYCVPGAAAPQSYVAGEGVIHILPRRSVQPPFPLSRIPLDVNGFQGEARRLVVYATVSETGEIANLRVVRGSGQPLDDEAVETLRKWVFRPATRGDAPVAVEALFGIPLK